MKQNIGFFFPVNLQVPSRNAPWSRLSDGSWVWVNATADPLSGLVGTRRPLPTGHRAGERCPSRGWTQAPAAGIAGFLRAGESIYSVVQQGERKCNDFLWFWCFSPNVLREGGITVLCAGASKPHGRTIRSRVARIKFVSPHLMKRSGTF